MKKLLLLSTCAIALVLASTAAAALVPGVYVQNAADAGCVTSTFSGGALHLAKTCPDATVVAAYGDITGLTGQAFTSASFTLANAAQCQGGSPRFNIFTTTTPAGTSPFFLGCNNVTPTTNADGSVTYTFDAASIAAAGLTFPTGTITDAAVLLDIQGSADVSKITVNGTLEVPTPVVTGPPTTKNACKHGGWKSFTNPSFKNQGQCVSYVAHHTKHGKSHTHSK